AIAIDIAGRCDGTAAAIIIIDAINTETVRPEESRKVEGRRRRPVGLAEHDITLTEATDLPLKSWGSMPSSRKPLTPSRVERSRAGVPDQSALPKMPTIKAAAPSPRLVTPMATALPTLGDANE